MKRVQNVLELIGATPMVRLNRVVEEGAAEVWGKLDAGTEPFYRQTNRTAVPFERVLKNLADCAAVRPIVIQAMFLRQRGEAPPDAEIEAWLERLERIESSGTIREVHVYTVARTPTEPWCTPLEDGEVDAIVERARARLRAPVRGFYGAP